MTSILLMQDDLLWIIPWLVTTIAYFRILRKMDLFRWTAIIPVLAERQLTKELYPRMRTFYRPIIVSAILLAGAFYLDAGTGMGRMFMLCACLIYGLFRMRIFWRIARNLGKGRFFAFLTMLVPGLFLLILAFGRSTYQPLPRKPMKDLSRRAKAIHHTGFVIVSAFELIVITLGITFLAIRDTPPEILVDAIMSDAYEQTKDITGTGTVVTRDEMMGKSAGKLGKAYKPSRQHFYKTHKDDESVVVMTYIVGSNLEDKSGLASVNIRQMSEATKQGDGLTFVVEAGGSKRWFTDGIEDSSYGRYTIRNGELQQAKALSPETCMSEPKTLENFIRWTKKNYPADRYMLVLWDHGGGVPYGYGEDELHERDSVKDSGGLSMNTIRVSEVVDAVRKSGIRFDLIGFDACLMQDLEIAHAFEPYADYYLASEETEGGFGWFYTSAFGQLAQNPGMDTEDFAKELIATYDPLNTAIKDDDGKPDTRATLSLVDLSYVKPAYERLSELLAAAEYGVRSDSANYADIAIAATNTYAFSSDMQIDLIDFLRLLDRVDYDDTICTQKEKRDLIHAIQACVVYRNGDSAKGINGMSFAFPYKAIDHYGDTHNELKALSLDTEKDTLDVIFSIMAAQQKKDRKAEKHSSNPSDWLDELLYIDQTQSDWYIKGFENYDNVRTFVDIPLKDTGAGYEVQLPKKEWKIISECDSMIYQKTDEVDGATMRYLGKDQIGGEFSDDPAVIDVDDQWVHIDGQPVCYEADSAKETEEGIVFTGTVRARLNDEKDILLHIEWDPVRDDSEETAAGHVIGYEEADGDTPGFLESKGLVDLEAGDSVDFLFDYYNEKGDKVETKAAGNPVRVTKQNRLSVSDMSLGDCDLVFSGVLTDVYQRTLTTEQIEIHFGE